jgi:predicted MFS family arabinose efflux permease
VTAGGVTASTAEPAPRPLWRQRNFMLLWGGGVGSALGGQAAGIAYPLLVLALTGSPATVGWVTALRSLPYLLLSLPVGAMVDRWDRRRLMLRCELGCAAAVGSLGLALWWGWASVGHIVAVALVEGTLATFYNLAQVATLPRVVARAQLPAATAQNQAGWSAAGVAGPALGTALYQLSRALPFIADALSYLLSAATLWRLRGDFAPTPASGPRHLLAEIATGLRWVWAEAVVRRLALLTGGINFVQAAVPLLLIVTAQQLDASEAQLGLIFSAAGIGGVLGALLGARVLRWFSFGQVVGGTVALQALLFPLYAVCPHWVWLGAVYGAIMFLAPIYNVVQFSHRLALIPAGLEGRVNAAFRFTAHCLIPVGAAVCGQAIERIGARATLGGFAAVLGALALWAVSDRSLHRAGAAPSGS